MNLQRVALTSTGAGGRLGNQLLTAINTRVLSRILGATGTWEQIGLEEVLVSPPRAIPARRSILEVSAGDLLSSTVFASLRESLDKLADVEVRIRGAMLGEHLSFLTRLHSLDIPEISGKPCRIAAVHGDYVALHYRGTDFREWHPEAIMPPSFYLRALKFLPANFSSLPRVLFTDDPGSQNAKRLISVRRAGIELHPSCGHATCDHHLIRESAFLISSPSTFAITAAIMGGQPVVFEKRWVALQAKRQSNFWTDVAESRTDYMNVYGIV